MATYTDNYNLIKPTYSEVADVATINTNMNTIDDIMHSTQVSLAPAYDSTQTYNTDDVVMYELLMYKCKENNVTGTWNASKWERTTAGEHGGGSDVEVTQIQTEGKAIASIAVDGVSTDILVPELKVYGEASGSIAEFDDGSNKPMSKCIAEIKAVQSGSGDPSPTNVRPISGFTEANIVVSPTANVQDGTTYSVSWESQAGTVYGGTLDVVSGELVVDMAMYVADGSESVQSVRYHASGLYFTIVKGGLGAKTTNPLLISSRFKAQSGVDVAAGNCYITSSGQLLVAVLPDQTATTKEAATQWFTDNPTQFVYELATPLTYQLTPIQVNSLLGINKVWNDMNGETEVKYRRDIEMLLQRIADSLGGNQ